VADIRRPWGKIHDFLLEFPSCRASYFSIDAAVGFGVKEIWAPVEAIAWVDADEMYVALQAELDEGMLEHLSRLKAPETDSDELKLHRLYGTEPHWVPSHRKNGGSLRKKARFVRGSKLIGYKAMTRQGGNGVIRDLLFDEMGLNLEKFRLEFTNRESTVLLDFDTGDDCQLLPQANALVISID
jgi:hypothetical protein